MFRLSTGHTHGLFTGRIGARIKKYCGAAIHRTIKSQDFHAYIYSFEGRTSTTSGI